MIKKKTNKKAREKLSVLILITVIVAALATPIIVSSLMQDSPDFDEIFKNPIEFISWQDLKPGQKGIGLTVFKGTKIEKFYVAYEGVKPHPLFEKEKIILVKMGKPLEGSVVISGMSGSPVYFEHDGKWKLLGSLGWGYGRFSSEKSIGGITPIQAMINQKKTFGLTMAAKNLKAKLKNSKNLIEELSKPITINGFQMLMPAFQIISSSGTVAGTNLKITRPKPGDAIVVCLAEGKDFNYGATCTVTHVDGNKFWACGHPFLGEGEIILPAFKVEIATSFKSPSNAFKLLSKKQDYVGFVSYDNAFGLEGQIQELPEKSMLPISFNVTLNKDNKTKKVSFKSSILKHKSYSERFILLMAGELFGNLWRPDNKYAATLANSTISFYNRKSVKLYSASNAGPGSIILKIRDFIFTLMDSEWDFKIKDIQINIDIREGNKALFLDSVVILDDNDCGHGDKITTEVRLGRKVKLLLGLKTFNGSKQFVNYVTLKIPDEPNLRKATNQNLNIYIESGNNFEERDKSKIPNHLPDTQEEFLQQLLLHQRDPQKIYVQVVFPSTKLELKKFEKISGDRWLGVKNLDYLRSAKTSEIKVVTIEVDSPLKDYVLRIKKNLTLQLLPMEEDIEDKKKISSIPIF